MTLYMLFAGLGILIYTGVAYAQAAVYGFSSAPSTSGSSSHSSHRCRCVSRRSSSCTRTASRGSTRPALTEPLPGEGASSSSPLSCSLRVVSPSSSRQRENPALRRRVLDRAEQGVRQSPAKRASSRRTDLEARWSVANRREHWLPGRTLFQERGCVGCHRPDATGVGPTLHGLFGSPVQYPGSGAGIVDESYLREAILNPSATVAVGFPPLMPTFAGQLTEEELQTLIVYVASLSVLVQEQRR
jgi:cytochrome c2